MDPRLLALYEQELRYFRESTGEFARAFPKIAARLGVDGQEVADPYVERLIEATAFLSARVHLKVDAEYPRFTGHLLDIVYPHFLAPTPACGRLPNSPLRPFGACSTAISTAPPHSPPTAIPCRKRIAISSAAAQ